jgi:hypothetical protein
MDPNRDFWFENMPSGNPAVTLEVAMDNVKDASY